MSASDRAGWLASRQPGSLVRAVSSLSRSGRAVDLGLVCVDYRPLGALPGILTTEPAEDQGLERRLPNAPEIGPAAALERGPGGVAAGVATSPATLRVRACGPEILRLTFGSPDPWSEAADGLGDAILVGPPEETPLEVDQHQSFTVLRTERAVLRVRHRPFGWTLAEPGGRELARSGGDRRQVAGLPYVPAVAFGDGFASLSLELAPSEVVAGLGEQFGSVVQNGRSLELVASDALGTGGHLVYKAAPLLHSCLPYSLFFHTPGPLHADLGASHPGLVELTSEEPGRIDVFLMVGDLARRLELYSTLTGKMSLPPRWVLGTWMSRCRYRSREELEEVAARLRSERVPCDVLHIDPDWLERDKLNCDFVWSEKKYPRPKEMFEQLHRKGYHVSVWELPYLDPDSELYAEAATRGFLVRLAGGEPAAVAGTPSRDGRPRGLVDFSNPEAAKWWTEKNKFLVDLGADVLKCDFGEGLPDEAVMADGRSGRRWRNLYPLRYQHAVALAQAQSGRPVVLWSRSGWAGAQRHPAHWGGDPEASVAGLASAVRAGLNWGLSAPGLWGHDIGGFYGSGPSPALYVRWAQIGCLSPLARFHGLSAREPWAFGKRALGIVRELVELRYRLLPYIWSATCEAALRGLPVMRPLAIEDPEDPLIWRVEHEFFLGPDLLVTAVLSESEDPVATPVVLPRGAWVDFWSGETFEGPCQMERVVPLERLPVFVRAGAVLAMGPVGQHTGEIDPKDWELHWWAGPELTTTLWDGTEAFCYGPRWADGQVAQGLPQALWAKEPEPRAKRAVAHLSEGEVELPVERRNPS